MENPITMPVDTVGLSILTGIVSAALLALFNWVIRELWKTHLSPWWENKLYSDARIDGNWESKLTTEMDDDYRERVTVNQVGHSVSGKFVCISGVDKNNAYEFRGTIRNTILNCYYWNTDKGSLDSGSFTLRLERNGELLVGYTTYYFDIDHSLKSRAYCWSRIPKVLKKTQTSVQGNATA